MMHLADEILRSVQRALRGNKSALAHLYMFASTVFKSNYAMHHSQVHIVGHLYVVSDVAVFVRLLTGVPINFHLLMNAPKDSQSALFTCANFYPSKMPTFTFS